MVNRTLALLFAALLLSACNAITPYKLEIPQGNQITTEQVAQLKVGMTRAQVRFVLGTPLLEDPFHASRWDYPLSNAKGGKLIERKNFSVFFKDDVLDHWEGDTLPAAKVDHSEFVLGASAPVSQ